MIRREWATSWPWFVGHVCPAIATARSVLNILGEGTVQIPNALEALKPYLKPDARVQEQNGLAVAQIDFDNSYTRANAAYFDNHVWASDYFRACHRDDLFKDRWRRAIGSWNDMVVVDIGCGPGNLFATLGGKPKALIGVDVSQGALAMAKQVGYAPLQADAHDLPLASEFADIVALNATLHHCDAMATVLSEAARVVRPGGILICDHDPQLTAWDWRGLAMLLYKMRLPVYRLLRGHIREEQMHRLASETHHRPGHGVTPDLFLSVLGPRDFDVKLYPHNNSSGSASLDSVMGQSKLKYRLGQMLSGIDPNSVEGALSLMCVAVRHADTIAAQSCTHAQVS
jgi:ubiquinone/menaquinone biosynthesis C-methylase UbiE